MTAALATLLCGCTDKPHYGLGMCKRHYFRERASAVRSGEWHPEETIDAKVLREHIQTLRKAGASIRAISRESGLSYRHLQFIMDGEYDTAKRTTARKLLRLQPGTIESGRTVPAIGITRRLQALNAMGYEHTDIAARVGCDRSRISMLCTGRNKNVSRALRDQILAVYTQLEMKPGPSDIARRNAARKGYAVPLLWNEESIDDPSARPSKYSWDRYQGGHRVVR